MKTEEGLDVNMDKYGNSTYERQHEDEGKAEKNIKTC